MRIYTRLTLADLEGIARDEHVRLSQTSDPKPITRGRNAGRTLYVVTLKQTDEIRTDPALIGTGDHYHQRISSDGSRKVAAICWHGHADFMTRVFAADSEARIETGIATYDGAAGFRHTYPETAYRNVGSLIYPCAMASACRCGFADMAIHAREGMLDA